MSDLMPAPAAGPSKLLLGAVGGLAILLVVGLAGLGYVLTNRPAAPPPSATPVVTATPATVAAMPTTNGTAATATRPPTATPFVSKEGTTPSPTKAPAAGTTPTTGSAAATTPTTATGVAATPTPAATGDMPQTGASQIGLGAALGLVVLLLAARALRLRKRA